MATYGDFSSLLQLGVGIGIGLSLFRAPVDLRVANLARTIDGEISALRNSPVPFTKQKRRDLQDLKLRFVTVKANLNRKQLPFMVIAVILAVANLAALVAATIDRDRPVSEPELLILFGISIVGYLLLLGALEILARHYLSNIQRDHRAIQERRAPTAASELAYRLS